MTLTPNPTKLSIMNTETASKTLRPRPLSPHLQVYSWLITNTLSILHRLTGVALCGGLVYVSAWLIIAGYYPEYYGQFTKFAGSIIGLVILAGWSVAFNYHFCNGIRHLFWDMGKGFELKNVTTTGRLVLVLTVLLTAAEWAFGLGYVNI